MEKEYRHFETERLFLKPTTVDDAEFVLRVMNTPKWHEYIGDRNVKNINDAKEYILAKMHPTLRKHGFSNYTMILKSNGEKIGSCGLYDRENLPGIDIGFALLPEYENQGFGYEGASEILRAARDIFQLKKISAITIPANVSSQKLLEKLGLQKVETFDMG